MCGEINNVSVFNRHYDCEVNLDRINYKFDSMFIKWVNKLRRNNITY